MNNNLTMLRQSLRLGIAIGAMLLASETRLKAESATPVAPENGLKEVGHEKVTWHGGFWGER